MNSIIFYKLGFKKSINLAKNIYQNDLLKNIKAGKSSYSLLHIKKGIILTREPFNVFDFSNQFLKLRTIFYISEGSIKADIMYDPFGFILSFIWIALFSIIPLGFLSVNDDIFLIIYVSAVVIIYALIIFKFKKTINSYIIFINAIMGN